MESRRHWFGWKRKASAADTEPTAQKARPVDAQKTADDVALSHHVDTTLADRLEEERRIADRKAQLKAEIDDLEVSGAQQAHRETDERRLREAEPFAEILKDPNGWVEANDLIRDLQERPSDYTGKVFVVRMETVTNRPTAASFRQKHTDQSRMVKVVDLQLYPDLLMFVRKPRDWGMMHRFIPNQESVRTNLPRNVREQLIQRQFRLFTQPEKIIRFLRKAEANAPGKKRS